MNVQLYLNVPFEQSARAKGMGARWDPQMRFWYVPHGLDINQFMEWWPIHLRDQIAKLSDPKKKDNAHAGSYKPKPAPHRIDLDVPFNDKNKVKALGAKYDSTHKRWYIEIDQDMRKFKRWINRRERQEAERLTPPKRPPAPTPEEQFQRDLEHAERMTQQLSKEGRA